jgi:hypothetical protein
MYYVCTNLCTVFAESSKPEEEHYVEVEPPTTGMITALRTLTQNMACT